MEDKKKILIVGEPGTGMAHTIAKMMEEDKMHHYHVITDEELKEMGYKDLPVSGKLIEKALEFPIYETHSYFSPPPTRAERRKKERNEKKKIISDNKRKKK